MGAEIEIVYMVEYDAHEIARIRSAAERALRPWRRHRRQRDAEARRLGESGFDLGGEGGFA